MIARMRRVLRSLSSVFRGSRSTRPRTESAGSRDAAHAEPGAAAGGLDLSRPEVVRDPYPHYAALRRSGSVHFLPAHGFWLVLGYDDVAHALKHPQLFSSVRSPVRFDPILNEADPPAHTRVRRAVSPHFSAQLVQEAEGYTRACARELLGAGGRAAELDLVAGFAVPLTELVVGRMLGLSHGQAEALRQRLEPCRRRRDGRLFRVLEDWMRTYLRRPRELPADSFAVRLLGGEGEASFTPEEVAGLMKMFWVAGTTTTSRLIPTAALLLLRHPRARGRVRSDPSLLPAFIEEALRLDAPEQMLWRVARPGAELSGTRIPAGAEVRLCVGAANRDPGQFAEPDRLCLRRSPNNHLSFGVGPHYCPGTRLARMQARVALETLLAEWPDFGPARPLSTISYGDSCNYREVQELLVTARPALG